MRNDKKVSSSDMLESILNIVDNSKATIETKIKENEKKLKEYSAQLDKELAEYSLTILSQTKEELDKKRDDFTDRIDKEFRSAKTIESDKLQNRTVETLMSEAKMFQTTMTYAFNHVKSLIDKILYKSE
jgi:predicted RNase H-like nuclease (RuvC/YqgF family)